MKCPVSLRKVIGIGLFTVLAALPLLAATPIKVLAFPLEPFASAEKGKIHGYSVDLILKMFKEAGLDAPTVEVQPLPRVAKALDEGNTLVIAISRTPEREPKYQWIADTFTVTFSFVTLAGKPAINSFADATSAGVILAVRAGAPESILKANGVSNVENSGNSDAQNFTMLLAGRGQAWFGGTAIQKDIINNNKAQDKLTLGKALNPVGLWIAGSKDLPADLVAKLQAAFKKLKANGEYDKIFAPIK